MSDEKPNPPNPLSDTIKGLGLLFRAARTVASKIPTKNLEEVVTTSAREVGRAFENVATTIERGVRGKDSPFARGPRPGSGPASDSEEGRAPGDPKDGDSPPPKSPG
jgi:hypothetical protein